MNRLWWRAQSRAWLRASLRLLARPASATALLLAGVAVAPSPLPAQAASGDVARAATLVVRVRAVFNQFGRKEMGSGFLIAARDDYVWIATARHVVGLPTGEGTEKVYWPADTAWVTFARDRQLGDSVRADVVLLDSAFLQPLRARVAAAEAARDSTGLVRARSSLERERVLLETYDVAALRIPRRALPASWIPPRLDRRGDPGDLQFNDDVIPMGCPRSDAECWTVPVPNNRTVSVVPGTITFQTTFVGPGISGGALFNRWWEIVGMVLESAPPRGLAIPIHEVTDLLGRANVPVGLVFARLPRDGYHLGVEASWLGAHGGAHGAGVFDDGRRLPSAMLVVSRRGTGALTWRLSASRLAPYNAEALSIMGGVGYTLRVSRLAVTPFVEVGASQTTTRHDAGGYYATSTGAAATAGAVYVPFWKNEQVSGANFGVGAQLSWIVVPHWSIAATAAVWNPPATANGPAFPDFFHGIGLRWNR